MCQGSFLLKQERCSLSTDTCFHYAQNLTLLPTACPWCRPPSSLKDGDSAWSMVTVVELAALLQPSSPTECAPLTVYVGPQGSSAQTLPSHEQTASLSLPHLLSLPNLPPCYSWDHQPSSDLRATR